MPEKNFHVAEMKPTHWAQVAAIYETGIKTGIATFETQVPSRKDWNDSHLGIGRIVALVKQNGRSEVVGWAALSPVSSRCVYGGVAEVSVYVHPEAQEMGIGLTLIKELIARSEKEGYWTLQSGIFPENKASIRLHEKAGFRKLGYRERIGKIDGEWKDNVLMERRSKIVGMD